MNAGDDYENVSLGKPSPWPLGQFLRIEAPPTHRNPRMTQVALVLLSLAFLAAFTAVIILYFQMEECTKSKEAHKNVCRHNVTTLTSKLQMLSYPESSRDQTLQTKKTWSRLENSTASSVVAERVPGHLETMTVFPVSIHQMQNRTSGVDPKTPNGPLEKDPKLGMVTESPGGPTKEMLEFRGVSDTPGVYMEKVSATVQVQTDVKMLKDLLEAVNASYISVKDEYKTILTLLYRGWKFSKGNLYHFSQKKMSWNEAESFCISWGAHLTSVISPEEQEFLNKRGKGISYWIGLTSQGSGDTWHWVDGTPYNETKSRSFWIGVQPSLQKEGKNCVEMQGETLSNRDCQSHLPGLCKRTLQRFEEVPNVGQRTELD